MKITYTPKFGQLIGLIHVPYQDKEGFFVVSKDRFAENYIRVKTLDEAYVHLKMVLKFGCAMRANQHL